MLLEALELLQSAGEDSNTYVTDFTAYKVINILTVYLPLFIATFILSQEVLGEKIACFPPENFTDSQAGALNEYCWTNGYWVGPGIPHAKNLYTQPHRYYAFYLAIQAVVCMSPIIFWNVSTKACLLAVLRGTEEFMEDLVKLITEGRHKEKPKVLEAKVIEQLHQFHGICMSAARDSNLSLYLTCRQVCEFVLFSGLIWLQFIIFDYHSDKSFFCSVPELSKEEIMCSVPVLDLLDCIWVVNVVSLIISLITVIVFIQDELRTHFGKFQPMFINDLPYGEADNFNEKVQWKSNFTKHSYELLTQIYKENATIMTQVYVLGALKPMTESSDSDTDSEDENVKPKAKTKDRFFAAKSKKLLLAKREARLARGQNPVSTLQPESPEPVDPEGSGLRQRLIASES